MDVFISFALGLLFLCISIYLLVKSIKTCKWLSTQGVIVSSKVNRQVYVFDENDISYKTDIIYEYTIADSLYTSKRVYYGDFIEKGWARGVKKTVSKYEVGKSVNVFYDSGNPQSSVIEKGVHITVIGMLVTGWAFIAIGIFLLLK